MRRLCGALLLALAVVGCGTEPVPDLAFEPLEKKDTLVKLSSFRGKVVLIDFWATWCGPCRESFPFIRELQEKYAAKGLQIVAITNEDRADVEKFEKEWKATYPVFIDTDNSVHMTFNIEGIPAIVMLDKQGRLIFHGHPAQRDEIIEKIESGLASKD